MTTIYALTEPTGEIRYVGKTILPLKQRLVNHIGTAKGTKWHPAPKTHKGYWIRSLLRDNEAPIIKALFICEDFESVDMEIKAISLFRKKCKLTN